MNWYGAHEDDGVAAGLERTGRRALAKRIARHGFNSVRLPFSLWMTEQTTPVPDRYLAANLDLSGCTPVQVYDACVEAVGTAKVGRLTISDISARLDLFRNLMHVAHDTSLSAS